MDTDTATPGVSDTVAPETETTAQSQHSGNWFDSLPDEVKTNPNVTKYTSIESAARGLINQAQFIGRDKIPVPKSDEEFIETFRKLGAPEKAEGYELKIPEIPENSDFKVDEKLTDWFKNTCAESGILPKQAQKLYEGFVSSQLKEVEQFNKTFEEEFKSSQDSLKEEWGNAYEGKVQTAQRVINEFSNPELDKLINDGKLGNDPRFIKMMNTIGEKLMSEGTLESGDPIGRTPADVQREIAEVRSNVALTDRSHPQHKTMTQRLEALYKELHPS